MTYICHYSCYIIFSYRKYEDVYKRQRYTHIKKYRRPYRQLHGLRLCTPAVFGRYGRKCLSLIHIYNGQFSTSADWASHKHNTNAGKTSEDGVWFGTSEPDDSKGALPVSYTHLDVYKRQLQALKFSY